jgi:hypothetical protein
VTKIVKLQKAVRFKYVHMIVRSDENFLRLAEPRSLVIDIPEGSLKADIIDKLDDAEVLPVKNEEITQPGKSDAKRITESRLGNRGVSCGEGGNEIEIAVKTLEAMIAVV